MRAMVQILTIFSGAFLIYRNRYKIINLILGNKSIRHLIVPMAMKMPTFRNRFMSQILQ